MTVVLWQSELGEALGLWSLVQFDATISETHVSDAQATQHPIEKGSDISDHVHVSPDTVEIKALVTRHPIGPNQARINLGVEVAPTVPVPIPYTLQGQYKKQAASARVFGAIPSPLNIPVVGRPVSPGAVTPAQLVNVPTIVAGASAGVALGGAFGGGDRVGSIYDELQRVLNNGTRVRVLTALRDYDEMVLTALNAPLDGMDACTFTLKFQSTRIVESGAVAVATKKTAGPAEPRAKKKEPQGAQPTYNFEEQSQLSSVANQSLSGLADLFNGR